MTTLLTRIFTPLRSDESGVSPAEYGLVLALALAAAALSTTSFPTGYSDVTTGGAEIALPD